MTDDTPDSSRSQAIGRAAGTKLAAPNPQGKGLVGFLLDWAYAAPRAVVAKPSAQVLADYFTSLLVLSAEFKFKPAFDTDYYLYWDKTHWSLSLISPKEWNTTEKRDSFAGTCVLHADSTWSILPSENLSKPGAVAEAIADVYRGFVEKLDSTRPLEDELPFYEAKLPYYQRLFAAALSRSLNLSMRQGGQLSIESRNWLKQLPRDAIRLLGPGDPE